MANITVAMHLPTSFTSYSFTRERLIRQYTKLIAMGAQPFYASDAGLSGGSIGAMHRNNWIAKTGNTKTVSITVDKPIYEMVKTPNSWGGFFEWEKVVGYEPVQKEVEVFEWKIVDFPRASQMLALMEQMNKLMKGE